MEISEKDRIIVPVYKRIKLRDNLFFYKLIDFIDDAIYNKDDDTIFYPKKNRKIYGMDDKDYTATDDKYCFGDWYTESAICISFNEPDAIKAVEMFKNRMREIIKFGFFDIDEEYLKIGEFDTDKMLSAPLDPDCWEYATTYDSKALDYSVTIPLTSIKSALACINDNKFEDAKYFFQDIIDSASELDITDDANIEDEDEIGEEDKDLDEDISAKCDSIKISETKTDALDELVGLSNVKNEVRKLSNYLLFLDKTKDVVNIDKVNLHMAFYGNPGTGKTTVARIIAKKLFDLGYVKSDKFAETTARDYIAGYIGQTAIKTRKILDANKGGVLFIDEAYIFNSDSASNECYADEAIVEILKELEKKETVFIFAGYKDEMNNFIEMNPGLKSRIGYHIEFFDYSLDELYQIFINKINKYNLKIGEGLEERVKAIFASYKDKPRFSNGRFVDNLIQKIIVNHADRTVDISDIEILTTLEQEDVDDRDVKEIISRGRQKVIKGFGGE